MKQNKTKICAVNESRHLVITPKFRVSFPQLFTARSFQDDPAQKKEFKIDMIFDSAEDFKAAGKLKGGKVTPSLMQAFANARADQWGADKAKWPKFEHAVFKKGDEQTNADGEVYQGYAGKVFLTAKTGEKFPPKVLLATGQPAEEKDLYGGCYAQAAVLARPYVYGKNSGVRFVLMQVRKLADGERFGGISEDLFDVAEIDEDIGGGSESEGGDDENDLSNW